MNTSVRFWDKSADRYSKRPIADEASYQRKLQVTRKYFRPDTKALEIACGTGSTAITHAPHVARMHAIDISPKMIEIARNKAAANDVSNVTFEQASIADFDVSDGSLDAVLAMSILHLLEDKDTAIAKAQRWLKPGGVFVTSTACLGDTMNWFKPLALIGRGLGLIPAVKFFTAKELRDSLVAAGFQIDHEWQPGRGKSIFIVARTPVSG